MRRSPPPVRANLTDPTMKRHALFVANELFVCSFRVRADTRPRRKFVRTFALTPLLHGRLGGGRPT